MRCPHCEGDLVSVSFGAGAEPIYCPGCDHYTDGECECAGCAPFGGDCPSETQAARDIDGDWQDNLGESPDY